MISEDLGIKLETVTLNMLGSAKRIAIDKENTTIVDGAGETDQIKGRVEQISAQVESTTSEDRKSVVWGKSVSVRVDLGGRRIIKKKNQIDKCCPTQRNNTIKITSQNQRNANI